MQDPYCSQVLDKTPRPGRVVGVTTAKAVPTGTTWKVAGERIQLLIELIGSNPGCRGPVTKVSRSAQGQLRWPSPVAGCTEPSSKAVQVFAERTLAQSAQPDIILNVEVQHEHLQGVGWKSLPLARLLSCLDHAKSLSLLAPKDLEKLAS
jgi:hypothetical protein